MFIELQNKIMEAFNNAPESNFVVLGGLECSIGKLRLLVDALRVNKDGCECVSKGDCCCNEYDYDYTIIRQQNNYSLLVSKILPPRIVVEKIEDAEFIY